MTDAPKGWFEVADRRLDLSVSARRLTVGPVTVPVLAYSFSSILQAFAVVELYDTDAAALALVGATVDRMPLPQRPPWGSRGRAL
jgi:hypothetical protein